ncbi:MAG: S4 domain-containing protein [Coprobacillus cateniformis]
MRLDKLLAHSGFGTRKEVKDFIKKGIVTVNGEIAEKDKMQVDPQTDEVCVNGEVITYEEFVYYMLNKPAYVSATEDNLYPTVVDLIDDYYQMIISSRKVNVDTGLLISNDGVLAHRYYHRKNIVQKFIMQKLMGCTNQDVEAFLME